KKADGRAIQRLGFQAVRAWFGVIVEIAGSGFAVGRDPLDGGAVIVNLDRAAARLLQIIELELLALGDQVHGLPRRTGAHANTAQAVHAVARAPDQSVAVPAARRTAFHV